jgi:opacity protein-like surface antigen
MRTFRRALFAATAALILCAGASAARAEHPRSSPQAAANKAKKDALRYGAGSTVTRRQISYRSTLGQEYSWKNVRVTMADGSVRGRTTTRKYDGTGVGKESFAYDANRAPVSKDSHFARRQGDQGELVNKTHRTAGPDRQVTREKSTAYRPGSDGQPIIRAYR